MTTCALILIAIMKSSKEIFQFESSAELKQKLYENSIIKDFVAGDIILNENAHIRAIPIVSKGSIRVMRTDEEDKEILLYYIKAGESCIMSFLGGMHHERSKVKAVAEEDTEILFLPVDSPAFLQSGFGEKRRP